MSLGVEDKAIEGNQGWLGEQQVEVLQGLTKEEAAIMKEERKRTRKKARGREQEEGSNVKKMIKKKESLKGLKGKKGETLTFPSCPALAH